MANEGGCGCGKAPALIFACSGAADVGAVADQAARKLTRDGAGKMFCVAGLGGRVKSILDGTKSAGRILAIDGCKSECVKHSLEEAGFNDFEHLRLAELGMEKGKTSVTVENIERAAQAGAARLACGKEAAQ